MSRGRVVKTMNPITVTSAFSEALLKFYFQYIPPPRFCDSSYKRKCANDSTTNMPGPQTLQVGSSSKSFSRCGLSLKAAQRAGRVFADVDADDGRGTLITRVDPLSFESFRPAAHTLERHPSPLSAAQSTAVVTLTRRTRYDTPTRQKFRRVGDAVSDSSWYCDVSLRERTEAKLSCVFAISLARLFTCRLDEKALARLPGSVSATAIRATYPHATSALSPLRTGLCSRRAVCTCGTGVSMEKQEISLRKLANQRHRPARFPHAKIRESPRRESNPVRLDERRCGHSGSVHREIPIGATVAQWIERFQGGPQRELNTGPSSVRGDQPRPACPLVDPFAAPSITRQPFVVSSHFLNRTFEKSLLILYIFVDKILRSGGHQYIALPEPRCFGTPPGIGCSRQTADISRRARASQMLASVSRMSDAVLRRKRLLSSLIIPELRSGAFPGITDIQRCRGGVEAKLLASHLGEPGRSRIFASGNRAGRCRWSAGFLGDLQFPRLFIPALLYTRVVKVEVKQLPMEHCPRLYKITGTAKSFSPCVIYCVVIDGNAKLGSREKPPRVVPGHGRSSSQPRGSFSPDRFLEPVTLNSRKRRGGWGKQRDRTGRSATLFGRPIPQRKVHTLASQRVQL
ncbi:hypothetical protein PR048_023181 [Dryococelus australis]|uniref:Uncharacterized protein n=1 Tax=Dryococelus australis TaxID=614101 RepID=A0ABQ9GTE8_9NEOP|nr:hypothetical protein PR048_023181 [Dryococelus australis]